MKLFATTLVLAFGLALYTPPVLADCGSCDGDKAHAHEPGHQHEAKNCEDCTDCGKADAACDCQKKAEAPCDCGKPQGECDCKKE